MNATTTVKDKRTIRLDYELAFPPEKVWRALTEAKLLDRWLMPNDFEATPGHRFTFRTEPHPALGFDGIVRCEVLAVEPGKRLSYSWRGGRIDTVVTWTLSPTAAGTLLHLEQEGFDPVAMAEFGGAQHGWNYMAGTKLPEVLASLT